MQYIVADNFDLKATLESGQFFRYFPFERGYNIVTRSTVFYIAQDKDKLYFDNISKDFVFSFFGLNDDYRILLKDKKISKMMKEHTGLKLMKQDPWECLVAFVCSQMSNIKRITSNLNSISEHFGKPVKFKKHSTYTFPNPGDINDASKLDKCKLGYRAKYLLELNNKVTDKWLASLKKKSYYEAKSELMTLFGIGDKVADCICLFSLGFGEAFPVDVWIERVMKEQYPELKNAKHKQIREFAAQKWGKMAGYAQQYLFHWRRNST